MKPIGWEARLTAYLRGVAGQPFDPGSLDCGLAAASAIEAITGVDPGAPLRGKYKTIAGAYRQLRKMGFADHVEYVASLFEEVPPLHAQRGDLAVVDGDDGPALGIVQGENIYVMMPAGMGIVQLTDAKRAFRI